MREVYGAIARALRDRRQIAVATLVAVRGAKTATVGTSLVVESDGSFLGDIGAGCHEGAIIERALEAIAQGGSPRMLTFELDDEVLAGSGCGASLDVVLWLPPAEFEETADALAAGARDVSWTLEGTRIEISRRRRLAIIGATALARELTALAQRADYAVTIIDPRPPFATRSRHPQADEILVVWPDDPAARARLDEAGAIVVLSHDAKLDLPALRAALASPAGYIALLGNRRVQAARRETLRGEGYDQRQLERIHGPAGLDLGASTDGQTAVAILAEMIAVEHKRSAVSLTRTAGPIHERL